MNIYFIIILSALSVEYLLNRVIGYLNIKSMSPILPPEFQDCYDEEKYRKSQDYTRTNERFGVITDTFDFSITLSIIGLGLFNVLDTFIRGFGYDSEIINGLLFFGFFMLIQDVITTPFSYIRHFVIEEKFGFNKMSISVFLVDKLKGWGLSFLFGIPLIAIILYFFESMGNHAWIYAWILISGFMLILQPLFITFIAPIFNSFTPLKNGTLRTKIETYLENVQFPITRLDMMDGSKRSSHSNAYFSGIGKRKRIALFDTLIEKQTDSEILAIVAHEVGHYKKKHIQKGMVMSILTSGLTLFVLSIFIKNPQLFSAFKMEHLSVYGSLIFFQILFSPINLILSLITNMISRKNEFEADKFSAETTGKPHHLISGLKKLTVENLGNLTPHPLNVFLNYSHPPVLERIRALSRN